jgi:hypothetical protein
MSSCMGLSNIARLGLKWPASSAGLVQNMVGIDGCSIRPHRRRKTEKYMSSIRRLSPPMILCRHRILCRWMYHQVH